MLTQTLLLHISYVQFFPIFQSLRSTQLGMILASIVTTSAYTYYVLCSLFVGLEGFSLHFLLCSFPHHLLSFPFPCKNSYAVSGMIKFPNGSSRCFTDKCIFSRPYLSRPNGLAIAFLACCRTSVRPSGGPSVTNVPWLRGKS